MSALSTEGLSSHRFTNRLAREKSPYLLQHAHNPVNWYPWGEEALEVARREDKPIFLSIGYSACHWCHVMERESFENEAIAALVNRYFVPIKVDREERPDVDEIYMTAVQRMTGSGGWPLSLFLLPDGRPFYGGTYFPPEGRYGRISFPSLIQQLGDAYTSRRDEIEEVAASIAADLETSARQRPLPHSGPIVPSILLSGAVAELNERFDSEHGGFGGAPKFPPHHALRLLLAALRDGEQDALPLLAVTLDKMALGGIYDHIGGGFHRYATDGVWLLPHFEKMLYDNALLLRVYAEASELLDNSAYARIARETADWVLRDLTDPATGGFEAALDADSEGLEGKYYVWSDNEVRELLGEAAGAFLTTYHFQPAGNFHEEATGHHTGTNIPYLSVSAASMRLPDHFSREALSTREMLLARRYERVPPGKDDKIITAWNGLMIGALAYAGKALGEERYLAAARRAANFCLTTLKPEGSLLRRYAKGEAAIPAFLDDYAFLADGLLDLTDATDETGWEAEARRLMDTLLEQFWDTSEQGFFYSGNDHETLIARSKDLFDGALPSPNGVAACVLARLGNRKDGAIYAERCRTLLLNYHGLMARASQATPTLILAAREIFSDTALPQPAEVLSLSNDTPVLTIAPGKTVTANFSLAIAPDYHINTYNASSSDRIATTATISTDAPAAIGPIRFPSETEWNDGAGTKLPVYTGTVSLAVPIAIAPDAVSGTYTLTLTVHAQPCNDASCQIPVERTTSLKVVVE